MERLPIKTLWLICALGCQQPPKPATEHSNTSPVFAEGMAASDLFKVGAPEDAFNEFIIGLLIDTHLYAEAVFYAQSATQASPNNASIWSLKGVALTKIKAFNDAEIAFSQAARQHPHDSRIRYQWGMSRLAASKPQEAAKHWAEAASLDPTNISAQLELIRYYRSNQRTDDASDQSVRAYEANPNDGRILLEVARSAVDSEGLDAVHARYNRAITALPSLIDAYIELAQYAAKHGEHRIARDAIARGERAIPRYPGWDTLKKVLSSSVKASSMPNDD